MARTDPQLNLRLPAELKENLEAAAAKNNRTTTAETVDRLLASFAFTASPVDFAFLLSRMEMRAAEAELDLSQMKLMLAEVCWALRHSMLYLQQSSLVGDPTLSKVMVEWNESLDAANEYVGHQPNDVEALENEVKEKLESFDAAFEKSKKKYVQLKTINPAIEE